MSRLPRRHLVCESLETRQLLTRLVLNEISVNPPGTDSPFEFVEIKGTPGATLAANTYFLSIEGDEGLNIGVADLAIDLGGKTIGSNGLLVIAAPSGGHSLPAATTLVPVSSFTAGSPLENNSNSFAIVQTPDPISAGTDFDPNDDGNLDGLPAASVILDMVGWTDNQANNFAYGTILTQPSLTPDAATRLRHASDADVTSWYCGDLGGTDPSSAAYNELSASENLPSGAVLTPGDHNFSAAPSNALPLAVDVSYTTPKDTDLIRTEAIGLLANSNLLDADGDILGITNVDTSALPANHELFLSPDGSFRYHMPEGFEGQVTFKYDITDGQGVSASQGTVTIQVGSVNRAPVIGLSGTGNINENAPAISIVTGATVSDADAPSDLSGGVLTVAIAANRDVADELGIASVVGDPLQFNSIAKTVSYQGTQFGVVSGGSAGGSDLVVTFDANATLTAVQALVRRITFRTVGDRPSTLQRAVTFTVSDGDGGTSSPATKLLNVIAQNDKPAIGLGGTATYTENATPTALQTAAVVTDIDSDNFAGGTLTVTNSSGDAADTLYIRSAGSIAAAVGIVKYLGTSMGTYVGGVNNVPLTVTLNDTATPTAVQELIRALRFRNTSDNPIAGNRTLSYQISEADGVTSNVAVKTVNVVAVNDGPLIAGGTARAYVNGKAQIKLAPAATMKDAEGNFAGGQLSITIAGTTNTSNRIQLVAGGGITIAGGNVVYAGNTIATIGAANLDPNKGISNTQLVFNLTSFATASLVQKMARQISFRTLVGSTSTAQRAIDFTVSDSNGAANTMQIVVNVS